MYHYDCNIINVTFDVTQIFTINCYIFVKYHFTHIDNIGTSIHPISFNFGFQSDQLYESIF